MSEYLRNLGEVVSNADTEGRRKRKDLAIEALATKLDATDFFNRIKAEPGALVPVSEYMREKGKKAGLETMVQDETLPVAVRIENLKREITRERTPVEKENDLTAGIESNALGRIVSPSEVRANREANLASFVSELEAARDAAVAEHGRRLAGKVEGVSGTGAKVGLAAQIGTDLFVGSGNNEVYNAVKAVLPEGGAELEGNRITNFGGAISYLKDYIQSLPAEQAEKVTRDFITDLAARSGTPLGRNYALDNNIKTILANLDGADTVTNALNGTIAVLEMVGIGAALTPKGVVKAGIGMAKGSAAASLAKGKAGAEALARAASKGDKADDILNAVDTSPEAVIGDLVMPKIAGQEYDPAVRSVDLDFLDEAKVAEVLKDELSSMESVISTLVPKNKINATELNATETGIEAKMIVGGPEGDGYANKGSATRLANRIGEGSEAVEIGGRWYAKYSSNLEYTSRDLKTIIKSESLNGRAWRGLLGRNVQFNGDFNKMANQAEFDGVLAQKAAKETLKPYTSLAKKEQAKVQEVILRGEREFKWYDDAELTGLTVKERQGYHAYVDLARKSLAVENARAYDQAIIDGFRGVEVAGVTRIAKPLESAGGAKKVLDLDGNVIPTPKGDYAFYRLPGEDAVKGKVTDIVAVPRGSGAVGMPPRQIVKEVPGYLPRVYDRPAFVYREREIVRNGVKETIEETIGTARSLKSAMEYAAEVGGKARYANEVAGETVDQSFLDALVRDGRLAHQGRKPKPLEDVDGGYTPPSVDELMGKMINAVSTNAGIGRFVDTAIDQLKRNYGDLGFTGIGKMPPSPGKTDASKLARYKEGRQFVNYLRNINGVGIGQTNETLAGYRNAFADMFYNDSVRASTKAGAAISKAIGDEISGLGTPISDGLKQAAFTAYLLLNPMRQAVLQATMVPTYAGAHGGFKYISSGKFVKDFAAMNGLGKQSDEIAEVARRFQTSGLGPLVDQHIFDLGRAAESGIKAPSMAGKALNNVKRIGMDLGVGIDKRGAFLFSHNRFKTLNGRVPRTEAEWKEVAGFAENLALNQNRSDTLVTQNGVLSLMTQFMSHQFKMTGRIFGLERNFSRRERLKMAAASVMSYGVAGYGFKEAYDNVKAAVGVEVPEPIDQVIQNGLTGAAFNMAMFAAGAPEAAFSEGFSPMNFLGGYGDALESLIDGTLSGSGYTLNPNFAALGFAGDVLGAVKYTTEVLGVAMDADMDPADTIKVVLPEYAKMFPFGNNLFKAHMAFTAGQLVDRRGNPIANTKGFAAGLYALIGLKTQSEQDYRRAVTKLYGEYEAATQDGILGSIADEAKNQAKVHAQIINTAYDGDLTSEEVRRIMGLHWKTINSANFTSANKALYTRSYNHTLQKEVMKTGTTAAKKLAEIYQRSAVRGEVLKGENLVNWIRMQEFEGADRLADQLETTLIGEQ